MCFFIDFYSFSLTEDWNSSVMSLQSIFTDQILNFSLLTFNKVNECGCLFILSNFWKNDLDTTNITLCASISWPFLRAKVTYTLASALSLTPKDGFFLVLVDHRMWMLVATQEFLEKLTECWENKLVRLDLFSFLTCQSDIHLVLFISHFVFLIYYFEVGNF